jgi:hypothetical protein
MRRLIVALAALVSASSGSSQALDFSITPVAAGSWSYAPTSAGSLASFMDSTGTARLTMQCTRSARLVTIARASAVAATGMTVWTSAMQRTLVTRYDTATLRLSADLSATDPLLDNMAFSRGRIAVAVTGTTSLIVPAWPELVRVIEDCRS